MAFTSASLDELLEMIGPEISSEEHVLTSTDDCNLWVRQYTGRVVEPMLSKIEGIADIMEIVSPLQHALDNTYHRAYDSEQGREVKVRHVFGQKGYLVQIIDEGKGFEPEPIIKAFQEGKEQRYAHYNYNGLMFRTLNKNCILARIGFSTKPPSGTTVSIAYLYKTP